MKKRVRDFTFVRKTTLRVLMASLCILVLSTSSLRGSAQTAAQKQQQLEEQQQAQRERQEAQQERQEQQRQQQEEQQQKREEQQHAQQERQEQQQTQQEQQRQQQEQQQAQREREEQQRRQAASPPLQRRPEEPTFPVRTVDPASHLTVPARDGSIAARPPARIDPLAIVPVHPIDAGRLAVRTISPGPVTLPRIPPSFLPRVSIAPRTNPVVIAPLVVGAREVRVVPAPSVTAVLALGNLVPVVPSPNAVLMQAQAKMSQAQAVCAQADAFSRYINGQTDSTQQLNQGTDQMLQALASQTSDPDTRAALLAQVGQPNPIDNALQQQLQNLAATSQINCQSQYAMAQALLSRAQAQTSNGQMPGGYPNGSQPNQSSAQATALLTQAQTALQNGDTATASKLIAQAQAIQSAATTGANRPVGSATAGSSKASLGLKVTYSAQTVVNPMYVAFSFSTPTEFAGTTPIYAPMDGDGTWGVAVNANEQTAIDNSGNSCDASSARPGTCGTGNGGNYPICKADRKPKWVALALSNDGTIDNWGDGEVISAETEQDADLGAVTNCGKAACRVVWDHLVDCTNLATNIVGGGSGAEYAGPGSTPTPGIGAPVNGTPTQGTPGTQPRKHCVNGGVCADPAI
jgi:hypothetical protein